MIDSVVEFLTEMPRIISPLKNTDKKVNLLWQTIKHKPFVDITPNWFDGFKLVEYDNQIFLIKSDKCFYYVNFEHKWLLNKNHVSQVYVWRHQDAFALTTSYVFWEILFERYSSIITDITQTKLGKEFWLRRVYEAFARNLFVYRLNIKTNELIHIKSMDSFQDNIGNYFGFSSKFENELIIISKVIL